MSDSELCVSCGENQAVPGGGTVALCAECKKLAQGKERGVKVAPKTPKKSSKKLSATR